ncbi:CCA tRNA nucleotidyltransferase [Lentibacillus cibarius]|uniref:CCA-adding enzyme n=2 Tax=Lentibacillus cibarius TaxID=2583219 RepID=A0A5S3QR56_9BACI|nr:CCA tRNA nucleotidyltransferase [Lentibacillus cibarius]
MGLPEKMAQAADVLEILEKNGHDAYFVGGCVRDLLCGHEIGDIDIATSATPDAVQKIFDKVIPVGLEHGTVIVRYAHQSYEVTTFRMDGDYSDQRHPDSVYFIQTIDEDLKRRDFTMNAMAMDKDGTIIDIYNGQQDIDSGLIRTVGNGHDRFKEDPLRIIRAVRFASQLGFSIAPDTLQAMLSVKQEIETIAIERIAHEMEKLFRGEHVQTGIHYLRETGIHNHLPVIKDFPHLMDRLPGPMRPLHSFGAVIAMLHRLEPAVSIQTWIKSWKCSNKVKQQAHELDAALARLQSEGLDRCLVYRLSDSCYKDFTVLGKFFSNVSITEKDIRDMKQLLPIKSKQDLAIDGNDIIHFFPDAKGGPWIGELLNDIEQEVIIGNLRNDKKAIRDWIK